MSHKVDVEVGQSGEDLLRFFKKEGESIDRFLQFNPSKSGTIIERFSPLSFDRCCRVKMGSGDVESKFICLNCLSIKNAVEGKMIKEGEIPAEFPFKVEVDPQIFDFATPIQIIPTEIDTRETFRYEMRLTNSEIQSRTMIREIISGIDESSLSVIVQRYLSKRYSMYFLNNITAFMCGYTCYTVLERGNDIHDLLPFEPRDLIKAIKHIVDISEILEKDSVKILDDVGSQKVMFQLQDNNGEKVPVISKILVKSAIIDSTLLELRTDPYTKSKYIFNRDPRCFVSKDNTVCSNYWRNIPGSCSSRVKQNLVFGGSGRVKTVYILLESFLNPYLGDFQDPILQEFWKILWPVDAPDIGESWNGRCLSTDFFHEFTTFYQKHFRSKFRLSRRSGQ